MILCDVAIESDLPEVWAKLANNGKRDRQTIELAIKETAQRRFVKLSRLRDFLLSSMLARWKTRIT